MFTRGTLSYGKLEQYFDAVVVAAVEVVEGTVATVEKYK